MAAAGVWIADSDGVQMIETTELAASRYALEHGGKVLFWPFGATREDAMAADVERRQKLTAKPVAKPASKPVTKSTSKAAS